MQKIKTTLLFLLIFITTNVFAFDQDFNIEKENIKSKSNIEITSDMNIKNIKKNDELNTIKSEKLSDKTKSERIGNNEKEKRTLVILKTLFFFFCFFSFIIKKFFIPSPKDWN